MSARWIQLFNNNLNGTIPSTISALTGLMYVANMMNVSAICNGKGRTIMERWKRSRE